jgi:GTP-binding protein
VHAVSVYPSARFLDSVGVSGKFPADQGAEAAIAGRSNAGKSSAINAITGRQSLARTSKTPGRTRLLNYFELAPGRRLVDLPGYGYARAPGPEREAWVPLIETLTHRASFRGMLLVVDARRGLLPGDEVLLDWAAASARPVHVLLSKADKLTRNEARLVAARTAASLSGAVSSQLFSAHDGSGVEEARRLLDRWLDKKETPVTL